MKGNFGKKFLSMFLSAVMVLGMLPTSVFAEENKADLIISTAEQLKAFADEVNNGNSYEGKTVVLEDDIDMEYTAVVIGTKSNPFKGTFDGQGYTVSNLSIYEDGSDSDYFADTDDCVGLFGVINTPAVVKNVTVHNPYIVGSSYVGGIVGMAYTGKIDNCHVTGEIDIEGFYMVGGITGHGYARIIDCSVIGEEGWDYNFIGGIYKESDLEGDNVGGIVGHNAENNVIEDCTVKNVTVSGTRKVGGIVGITAQSTDISGCSVDDVIVATTATADYANSKTTTMSIGGIVGQYMQASKGIGGTLADCSVSGLTFANENDVEVKAGALTGGVRVDSGAPAAPAEDDITVSGASVEKVSGATVTYMEPVVELPAVILNAQTVMGTIKFEPVTGDTLSYVLGRLEISSNLFPLAGGISIVEIDVNEDIEETGPVTVKYNTVLKGNGSVSGTIVVAEGATLTVSDTVGVDNLTVVDAQGNELVKNESGTYENVPAPTSGLTNCYTSDSGYWGECGGNAKESFVFKFYNGNTYMGYTSLNNVGGIIDGDVYVSWSIKLDAASNTDEYWTMAWDIQPTLAMQPTRVEHWVDGVKAAECAVEPNWSDKIFPVMAAVTNENGEIVSYVNGTSGHTLADAVKKAQNGQTITLLRDVTVSETLVVPSGITLAIDGNGHEITPASGFNADGHHAVIVMAGNDSAYDASNVYTIKNVEFKSFSGLTRVIRANFSDAVIENCVFSNNSVSEGVITSAYADLTVKNCEFNGNTAGFAVLTIGADVNNGTELEAYVIDNSFTGNSAAIAGVYLASSATVTGNYFNNNTHIGDNVNGAAILAGPYTGNMEYSVDITDNAFDNAMGGKPAVFAEDWSSLGSTTAFDLSENYWGGGEPVYSFSGTPDVTLESYYTAYSTNASGNVVLKVEDKVEIKTVVAKIGDVEYETLEAAADAAQPGDEIVLFGDATLSEELTLPAGIILNGNGKQINGNIVAGGDLTIKGHTKVSSFNAGYNKPTITIGVGACLEMNGSGRMVIGHGATFNITGSITDAKTADKATIQPSLIAAGASFTGSGVNFNVTNAYLKFEGNYCSSSKTASGTFDFDITNSIWDQVETKLAFEAQSVNATVNFELKDSVLTTGSHLIFAVPGAVIIDNSKVNEGVYKQLENRSTMTIKNGSVVYGSVQVSSNAQNPGTVIVDNATYITTGEFSGVTLGTGKLILKNGANATVPKIGNATVELYGTDTSLTCGTEGLEIKTDDGYEVKHIDGVYQAVEKQLAGSGTAEDPYQINSIDDLKLFRNKVNAGNSYDDKYVKLMSDIDLAGIEWTPIGTGSNPFNGMFDGDSHVINNLTINGDKTYVKGGNNDNYKGLFGYMKGGNNAGIKNLTIENAKVTGCLYVGAVLGRSYTGGILENCHVKGTIQIDSYAYAGGVVGRHEYSADVNKVAIKGCTVDGAALTRSTSFVNADYEVSYVGGIVGFLAEGKYIVEGCSAKNIAISGVYGVGGISGIGHYGNEITNAAVDGVTVTSNDNDKTSARTGNVGLIVGACQGTTSEPTVIKGAKADNTTATVTYSDNTTTEVTDLYGNSMTGVEPVTNFVAKVAGVAYETLQDAINAADGKIVTLLKDIVLEAKITIPAGKTVTIDLNGKTVDGTEKTKIALASYGNLTIKDSSNAKTGIIKAGIGTAGNAINICGGSFTLESGSIYSKNNAILIDEEAAVINIKGGKITAEPATKNSAAFYISGTSDTVVNITGGEIVGYNGILLWNNTKLDITGGSIDAKGSVAIQGNGTCDNTEISISGDAEISGYYAAIYHPQNGKLTISDNAKLTGWTGVVIKSGKVTISGGTISGTGDAGTYAPVSSGFIDTGDALYVEHFDNSTNSENYGTPEVTVTGGTFKSTNGEPIGNYANSNNAGNGVEPLGNYVSGGIFNKMPAGNLLASGYQVFVNTDGTYGVQVAPASYVASVDGEDYTSLQDAIAVADGKTVYMKNNTVLTESITIPAGKDITIDLKGYTISGTDNSTGSFGLITNRGILTVKDSKGGGAITLTATNDRGWSSYSSVISNTVGGKLIVESGTIKHLGGSTMAYGIDNLTNGKGTYAETVIKGGIVDSSYIGIRQFLNGVEATNKLTIEGGTVTGANSAIYFQSPSAKANTGSLTIKEGATISKRIYLGITDGTTEWPVEISVAKAALAEGVEIVGDKLPAGYAVKEMNGTYGVVTLAGSGTEADPYVISTLDELILFRDSVNAGETKYNASGVWVALGADIDMSSVANWTPIGDITYDSKYAPEDATKVFSGTFDGNGKVISNLAISKTVDGADVQANAGLFGITGEGAVIKDLSLTNVNINTDGRNVGALAGFAYKATLENITVNGNIQIKGGNNVAGVCGMTRHYDMSATNITVKGNDGSAIVGNNIVGGIFAEIAPNGSAQTFKNLSVDNVVITGVGGVGGIVGLLTLGTVDTVSVKDVVLTGRTDYQGNAMGRIRLGSVAGLMGSSYATIINATVANVSGKNLDGNAVVLPIIGANYDASSNATEAKIGNTYYATLAIAIAAAKAGDEIEILCDVTEEFTAIENVTLTTNVAGGVTVTNTNTGWPEMSNVNIDSGVTLKVKTAYFTNAGVNVIRGTVNAETFYNADDSKTTVQNGGKIVTTGMIVNRYHYNTDSGIYVYGDGDASTVEVSCGDTIGTYSGTFYAKDAVIEGNMFWIDYKKDSSEEADKYSQSTPKFENSVLNVTKEFRLYKDATLTLVGSSVTAGKVQVRQDATPVVTMDSASVIKASAVENLPGASINAVLGADNTVTFKPTLLKGSGTEANPYVIKSLDDLILFRDSVNAGENKYSAPGVYVELGADIDIAGLNWIGIGSINQDHGFMGNFDGKDYKIKNLTITNPALVGGYAYAGFFGVTEGTETAHNTIKNLTIENVTIDTTGDIVAAAVAYPYYTDLDNITVSGKINITGGNYTAGVVAYTRRCTDASNLTISGNDGSAITGKQTVGGVISDIQMNGGLTANYSNFCASGLTITGEKSVGGISGIIAGQTLNTCKVANVTLVCGDARVGTVSGSLGAPSSITNATVENVTGATALIGGTYDGGKPVQAKIGDKYYATLDDALEADKAGDTITLLTPYVVEADKTVVLDLKGKTVVYNSTVIGEAMITNKGTLTINDTVGGGVINYNYTGVADSSYGKGNYTISNAGTLTVNGGKITIANLSGHAKYPIDNNSTTGDAVLVINGGHLYNYNTSAIRQFCNSTTYKNSVTINGGLIEGYSAIWVQNPGDKTVNGQLTITGGEVKSTAKAYVNGTAELKDVGSAIYFTIAQAGGAWTEDSLVTITGGTFNENVELSEQVPAEIMVNEEKATFNGRLELPKTYIAQVGDVKCENLIEIVDAVKAKSEAGENVTVKFLRDAEIIDYKAFDYGTGNITFTADEPVTITLKKDFDFAEGTDITIKVEENVTLNVYDNVGGIYVYYGPGLLIEGTITGGQNWGCLYLAYGEHTIAENGTVSIGRTQLAWTKLAVNGKIDSNYLLVEESDLILDGANVDVNYLTDTNNGGLRYGKSDISITNGSVVKAGTVEMKHADSVLTIDLTSSITANTVRGAGKIVVDATAFADETVTVISGDLSGFTGLIEVINNDDVIAERTETGLIIKKNKPVSGEISYRAYINDSETREAIQIDLAKVYAKQSLVVELYDANGSLLTTTSLKAGGVEADKYTVNIVLWGNPSGSWDTVINTEKLTVANAPETIKLYCDGTLVDTYENAFGAGTNVNELPEYLALDCVYKAASITTAENVTTYYMTLAEAVAAATENSTINLLANDQTAEVSKPLTISKNGFTANVAAGEGFEVEETTDSYIVKEKAAVEPEIDTIIKAKSATLLLEDMIQIRYKFAVADRTAVEYGMYIFASAADAATYDPTKAIQTKLLKEYPDGFYGYTDGIAAKEMGDSQFMVGYAKLANGEYAYTSIREYSPKIYAKNMIGKSSTSEVTKHLCNAMMNYGAAAQIKLGYKTNDLMNVGFDAVTYDAAVLGESVFYVDTTETNGFTTKAATLLLDGTITYRIKYAVNSQISTRPLYMEYTVKGVTDSVELQKYSDGSYGYVVGIAAKDMDETLVVKPYYLDGNGDKVYGAELVYSGYEYTRRTVANSTGGAENVALAKAFAMYVDAANTAIK